ncbi:acylphosphatase-1-like isoform X1 [Rhynchophorus ferrugineus]|uniref:acylphosphatase-1-like isoform X1 n=1 Tax=Rhynchophorus ferrugineus TaxID=354439 RepID=UPI003FCE73AF
MISGTLNINITQYGRSFLKFSGIFKVSALVQYSSVVVSYEIILIAGVSFKRDLRDRALKLGIRGYCMNQSHECIAGEIQGTSNEFNDMKMWLAHFGSPGSTILDCRFRDERLIPDYTYTTFTRRRNTSK